MKPIALTLLCTAFALPLAVFAQTEAPQTKAEESRAAFINTEGTETGTATLTGTRGGVLIDLDLGGLPANAWLGFHVHETGTCDPHSAHESAGGHFNPTNLAHGVLSETGPHAGDMPNIHTDADGVARVQVFNPYVSLGAGENSIRGRALMVHAGADDHRSQPSGNAGDRLACAVIE
ncbi:superoxide dismutase family protein [Rhodobacter sp. 24-YEA-8]|uniref:superoxide dismutase family protein n=1 Tax=Rhodobacter sp. 24-YEA-8 TaxID=1884310 RepID=UPI00089717D0|nr:superoxide dismutase family protein [Rhodobacter sp. 24-YEA-8]SED50016.1 superoxide dismutase, Cu-Zn family [Rhodobacter sp. 24-YEA-8]